MGLWTYSDGLEIELIKSYSEQIAEIIRQTNPEMSLYPFLAVAATMTVVRLAAQELRSKQDRTDGDERAVVHRTAKLIAIGLWRLWTDGERR